MLTSALFSAVKQKESAVTASALKTLPNKPLMSGHGAGQKGEMDVLQAPSSFASSPDGEEYPGLSTLLPAWGYPLAGDLGQPSLHLSIILRTLSLQHFAVSHVPIVSQRPLCFQNWGKFSFP